MRVRAVGHHGPVARHGSFAISRRFAAVGLLAVLSACERGPAHHIVPLPRSVEVSRGSFVVESATPIVLADAADSEAREIAELWAAPIRAGGALELPMTTGSGAAGDRSGATAGGGTITLAVTGQGEAEGYRLTVTADGVSVAGNDHAGLFYGLQSLSQLLPPGVEAGSTGGAVELPAIDIDDAPRFAYRGMHLDVARHFFEPAFVKRYIDLLARYKINRFHWHLTEDQGWRIQIDAYPRLTEVGAWRAQTQIGHGLDPFNGDGQRYGGFYTKDEVRDIVAYAQARYVTVIPEIEMPGHSLAALAAYPELACTEGPFEVGMTWGVFEDIYCPTEQTFEFLENVLAEVVELFPGEYVHIGGDEAPKARWEESPFVRRLMQSEGMNEVEQVQGYFIRRIERFLRASGKRVIGWDEILEGGLPEDATVMSWRGMLGGIQASRMGHEVVMTPYSHLYFDYYQSQDTASEPFAIGGFLPLDTVYAYEPVPYQLRREDAARIIGAQANVWTEYMKTPDHVEYMLLPRMLALSEVVWSPAEAKNFENFLDRLAWHAERFDALGINHRPVDR